MRNYAFKLIGEGGVRLLSTVFLLILARFVGAAEFGVYSTAFAFATVFSVLVDLGTNPIITREMARWPDKREQIVGSVNTLKVGMCMVMWLLLWATTEALRMPAQKALLVHWFGWVVIGTAFTEYFSAVLTGVERMASEAGLKILSKGVVMTAALIALLRTHDMYYTVRVLGLFSILSVIIGGLVLYYRLGFFAFHFDAAYVRQLLLQSYPVFGVMAFMILYDSQDILLLNYFKIPDHEIGLFAMALKVIDVIKVLPVLLASSFLPVLSRHAHLSPDFAMHSRKLLKIAVVGFPLLAAMLYIFASPVMHLLYGSVALDAIPVLRWLLVGFLIMAFNLILMQVLIALDKEKQLLVGTLLLCISHIVACLFLIPPFGILGAAFALIISEIIYLAAQGFLMVRVYRTA